MQKVKKILDLGCGNNKKTGAVGIDISQFFPLDELTFTLQKI
jgi:hypothetical protein